MPNLLEMRDLEFRKKFGNRLQAVRKGMGMTQQSLAHTASIHVKYLSELENGHKSPTLEVIAGLASALGVQPSDLMPDMDIPEMPSMKEARWLEEHGDMLIRDVLAAVMKKGKKKGKA